MPAVGSLTKSKLVTIKVAGIRGVTEAITSFGRAAEVETFNAVVDETQEIAAESQMEVPRQTGHLSLSMRVKNRQRPAAFGIIDYVADYALWVHEMPRPPSSNGKWHFLSDPLKRAKKRFAKRVLQRILDAAADAQQAIGRAR